MLEKIVSPKLGVKLGTGVAGGVTFLGDGAGTLGGGTTTGGGVRLVGEIVLVAR